MRINFWSFLKKEKKKLSMEKKTCLFHQKSEGILHLLFAGIACKIYFLMPSNFDEKMPLNYDKFCPLKMMAFMIIKGNIICWHFLKALPSANTYHCILRERTVYFSDEVFPLKIWGHFIQQCTTHCGGSHHWATVYRILNWWTSNIRSLNDSRWLRMTWDKFKWLKET